MFFKIYQFFAYSSFHTQAAVLHQPPIVYFMQYLQTVVVGLEVRCILV